MNIQIKESLPTPLWIHGITLTGGVDAIKALHESFIQNEVEVAAFPFDDLIAAIQGDLDAYIRLLTTYQMQSFDEREPAMIESLNIKRAYAEIETKSYAFSWSLNEISPGEFYMSIRKCDAKTPTRTLLTILDRLNDHTGITLTYEAHDRQACDQALLSRYPNIEVIFDYE